MTEPGSPSLSESGRLVRKESLSDRVRSAPHDWLMRIQEDWETLDWDSLQETLSWPAAIILNGAFLFLRLSHSLESPEQVRFGYGKPVPSGWIDANTMFWINLLEVVFFVLSLANTVYLFTRSRHYQLFDSSAESTIQNPNVRTKRVYDKPSSLCTRLFRFIMRPVWRIIQYTPDDERQVHILYMWDSPVFSLNIFCWWSPPQLAVYFGLNAENWPFFLPVALAVALQTYYLCRTYVQHVKDKQLLFGQVYSEYNTKFVNKSIGLLSREQSTLSDSNNRRTFSMSSVPVYDQPMTKSFSFTTMANSGRRRRQQQQPGATTTTTAMSNGLNRQRTLSEHQVTPTSVAARRKRLGVYEQEDRLYSNEDDDDDNNDDYSENRPTHKEATPVRATPRQSRRQRVH